MKVSGGTTEMREAGSGIMNAFCSVQICRLPKPSTNVTRGKENEGPELHVTRKHPHRTP